MEINLQLVDGKTAQVIGAYGLHLSVNIKDAEPGLNYTLIGVEKCKDSRSFWEAWKATGGTPLELDDGTMWDPTEQIQFVDQSDGL
jgi:hypothetical protein